MTQHPEPATPAPALLERCWVRGRLTKDRCTATATHEVTAGCVHEHITTNFACGPHAEKLAAGNLLCVRCWESREPHRCRIVARVRPAGEAATR